MSTPTRSEYRTVIVGAGVIGLYTAYYLARAGAGPILVVDRGFLSSGASGRNGGGVRQQWETRATVRLARESVGAYRRFARDFGVNPWFRQSGYVFLAENGAELERLRRVHDIVASEGLPSEILDSSRVARLVPGIAPEAAVGGTYLSTDGTLYPFPVVWGLYEAVRAMGTEVLLGAAEALVPKLEAAARAGHLATNPACEPDEKGCRSSDASRLGNQRAALGTSLLATGLESVRCGRRSEGSRSRDQ